MVESGPVVCACRNVRAHRIAAAIAGGAASVDAVSEVTTAGSACGSCRPEIARMLAAQPEKQIGYAA
jgi:assimilatory nitrate reductase catalytic subunit